MIRQYVKIKTDFEAIHNWPECPFKEVSFLKHPHRHKIFITVKIETTNDRQIEFFMLKNEVDNIIDKLYGNEKIKQLGRKSMEEICHDIRKKLTDKYYNLYCEISASEDDQVCGIVEVVP